MKSNAEPVKSDAEPVKSSAEPVISDALALLLDLDPEDRDQAEILMGAAHSPEVVAAVSILRQRLGTFPVHPVDPGETAGADPDGADPDGADPDGADPDGADADAPEIWICALLLFAPELAAWQASRSIDPAITAATLADFGRQFRLHRITHGTFGLETWGWLTWHCGGGLYQLGRLHFLLRTLPTDEPAPPGTTAGDWVLDVHIPPIGPLRPDLVDDAFRQAATFFATHFPEHPVTIGVCFSWLLDPYLSDHLPGTNMAAFQQSFEGYGLREARQKDALYFVFRTRDQQNRDRLPRDTSLQRLVLDRIDAGGVWQACYGWRPLG